MKIAILGTRGVPPAYGGFETFAGELSTRLAHRGHDVYVYCRSGAAPASGAGLCEKPAAEAAAAPLWNGVHRIELPAIRHKYFETVSHTLLSALDALFRDFDAVLVCNAANAFVLPLLRAKRMRVAINVDGIERRRRKWNAFGRAVYAIGEAFSASFATVIADAEVIARYYREQYQIDPVVIPYGAEFPDEEDSDVLQRLGVKDYILYVSRFEPENNPLEVVREYERLRNAPPLVMVGTGLYALDLVAELHRHASDKILLPGAIYGRDYRTLQRNALLYIQATEVGGTHPALIEAMASGGRVLAHDTPENREAGGDAVGYFDVHASGELSGMISEFLRNPLQRDELRARARLRASRLYSWERVTDAYERLFGSHGLDA
ncbi:MAG: glycosyl transferase family 1 [Acidobacteria bacterium]|nr:MAG: glycosyl transferase family 1 [Acidobacteriota bacterium]